VKKASIIALIFLYLIPSIGISVTSHFCRGKLASTSIGFLEANNCACGSKKMKKGCCENKTQLIKLEDDQQKSQFGSLNFIKPVKYVPYFIRSISPQFVSIAVKRSGSRYLHPPGDKVKHDIYLLYQSFLI